MEGQLADVLDAKRRRQRAIVEREADFLVGFAAGDLERRLGQTVGLAAGERGVTWI